MIMAKKTQAIMRKLQHVMNGMLRTEKYFDGTLIYLPLAKELFLDIELVIYESIYN